MKAIFLKKYYITLVRVIERNKHVVISQSKYIFPPTEHVVWWCLICRTSSKVAMVVKLVQVFEECVFHVLRTMVPKHPSLSVYLVAFQVISHGPFDLLWSSPT